MMNLGKMWPVLAVPLVFLTSPVIGKWRSCLKENNEFYDFFGGCKKCDPCPPGKEPDYDQDIRVDPKKGALECVACRSCQQGSYSNKRSRQRCSPCRKCAILYRHSDLPCTATQNAVCGQCLPGYYDVYKRKYNSRLPQYDKACMPCNHGVYKNVPECTTTTPPATTALEGRTSHTASVTKEAIPRVASKSQLISTQRPCRQENNEYHNSVLGCHKCDNCPPGKEPDFDQDIRVDPKKGALECVACRSCQQGSYSNKRSRQRCSPCRKCAILYRHSDLPCTATQNAVCGQCLPGYYDVYKRKYNSTVPQYDKACMPCDHGAHKNVQECANTTPPTTTELEGRTSLSESVVKEALVTPESETPNTEHSNAFHKAVVTAMIFVVAGVVVFLLIAAVAFLKVTRSSKCHRQQPGNLEVELGPLFPGEKAENLKRKGNPNSSLSSNTADRGSRTPLLPTIVTTDEGCSDQNSVASKSNYRVIQKRIGKQWKDLARALAISDPDIEKLEMDHPDTRERIYQLLLHWERTSESEALLAHLCSALQSIDRHDVAIELL